MATVLIIGSLLFICISQTGVYVRRLPVFVVTLASLSFAECGDSNDFAKLKGAKISLGSNSNVFGRSYASPKIVGLLLSEHDALLYIFIPF